jgi:dTDP-4-amino-4,6-dideoxygalactose transaminase
MSARVPFLDPRAGYRELESELDAAYQRVMGSGSYILGAELEAFEAEFAEACGSPHAVGVGNGLEALKLVMRAAGIGPGDEVVVPAQTFIASWLAATEIGATPVPADVDEATLTMDPAAVRAAIGPRTAALMPVHLYGQPADMDPLMELARQHGLFMLEDAAQAHGARLDGRAIGSLGDAAGFSFYPAKNLGAFGDGGAVTCGSSELADSVRRLRNYGSSVRYIHDEVGGNSRLDPLQAAFLRTKLRYLDRWNDRRSELADRYLQNLAGIPGLILPRVRDGARHVWHIFCIRHPERDQLAEHLDAAGVDTLIHYPVVPYLSGAYATLGFKQGAFPVAEQAAATCLSLPIGPHLLDAQADRVIEAVRSYA